LKLHTQQSRLDVRKFSFAVRVVKPWNALLEVVVAAPSVQAFEARLDKAWNDQPLKFHCKKKPYNDLDIEDFILRPVNSDDDDQDDIASLGKTHATSK